ncbi:hypothetical protein ABK040_015497 [Willaertia magna]
MVWLSKIKQTLLLFRNVLNNINDRFTMIVYSSYFNSIKTYKSSKYSSFVEIKKTKDLDELQRIEPLFEKDLFLFFIFKNHLFLKYLNILENEENLFKFKNLLSENCFEALKLENNLQNNLQNNKIIKVTNIESMDIVQINFVKEGIDNISLNNLIKENNWKIYIDVEIYFYTEDNKYLFGNFKLEKLFTLEEKEIQNKEERIENERERLERFILGWKLSTLPNIIELN